MIFLYPYTDTFLILKKNCFITNLIHLASWLVKTMTPIRCKRFDIEIPFLITNTD